jgi:hypothetical protein
MQLSIEFPDFKQTIAISYSSIFPSRLLYVLNELLKMNEICESYTWCFISVHCVLSFWFECSFLLCKYSVKTFTVVLFPRRAVMMLDTLMSFCVPAHLWLLPTSFLPCRWPAPRAAICLKLALSLAQTSWSTATWNSVAYGSSADRKCRLVRCRSGTPTLKPNAG